MWPLRRAHALALLAAAALLLLLLARLPLQPPAPAPPAPAPARPPARLNRTEPEPTPSPARPPSAPPAPPASPAAKAQAGAGAEGGAVLVRALYEAGHWRAHPALCPALGARLRLLVLVTSAPAHAAARRAVRLTWGHWGARSDVALGFVLGAGGGPQLQRALLEEDALHGDLIVARSLDSYSNLTLKTLSMLEWADTYCPRAPRLLKTDDDMFINVPAILDFLADKSRINATNTIWGKVVRGSLPKRTRKSKYFVSTAQFPGRVFPAFATGPAYVLTGDAVRPLLRAAPSQAYLPLEDVFVTGVLAQQLSIARRHAAQFYNKKVAAHPCAVQRGFAIHMVRYHEQFDLWRKLLDGKTKCAS